MGAALLISAFMIHGIQPGPSLFETQGVLIYAILGSMVMANFINLAVGLLGLRLWVRVIKAPETLIYFTSLVLCICRGISIKRFLIRGRRYGGICTS